MTKKQTELSEELREAVFEAARAGAAEAYTQNTGYVNYFKAMETLLYNYKKLAALVADEEAYLCERCSTPDDPVTSKIAHHKTYLTKQNINDPYIALSWDNLEALCQDCHNKEHHRNDKKKRYAFDEAGNLISPPIRSKFREGETPRAGG